MPAFEKDGVKIGLPKNMYLLRLNKQAGMFATSMVDITDATSVATYGRGKMIEFVIANCETGLFGTIAKAKDKKWAFVSAVITKAEDARLVPGMLLHFPVYGFESDDFNTMQSEAEIESIFGEIKPQVIRMEFNRQIGTQHGSIIKPPSISIRACDKRELKYFNAAQEIPLEYPQYLPDPVEIFPPIYEDGKLTSGLMRGGIPLKPQMLPGASTTNRLPAA